MSLLQQDLDYQQSLLTDLLKNLERERQARRIHVSNILASKIPNPLSNMVTPEMKRLLNVYRLSPGSLNPEQRSRAERISSTLNRWNNGGCYNLTAQDEERLQQNNALFSFNFINIPVNFCIDLYSPLQTGHVNANLGLVDIYMDTGDNLERYPLDPETSQRYLSELRNRGIDALAFPQMKVNPEIEQAQIEVDSLTLQLHPELIS